MAINASVAARSFQQTVKAFEQGMFHFDLSPTVSTNNMVMVIPGNLVGEASIDGIGWTHKPVIGKEFKRAVDSRFGQPG